MIEKVKDLLDTNVSLIILADDLHDLGVLAEVLNKKVGLDRCTLEAYKDTMAAYMIEIRMPHNRYLVMMDGLLDQGYTLRQESEAEIINWLTKIES